MKTLLKIIKWLLILIIGLVIIGYISMKVFSEERPVTLPNENADAVANNVFSALNKPAWDTLKYMTWEFRGGHKYLWDKQNNNAVITWGENRVILSLNDIDGKAFVNGEEVANEKANDLIHTAWSYWCNDSFWMFAPFKLFDEGTTRSIVETGDEHKGLMITYESGGVTPGDSYLWLLDKNNIPTGYKMWTFIPLQGMYMSWEDWKTLKGGAKVAITHNGSLFSMGMKDVLEGDSPSELGYENDIFNGL